MIKIIYFDFDGVVAISKPGGYATSEALSTVLDIPQRSIDKAFKMSGRPFLLGKDSIDEFLSKLSKTLGKEVNTNQLDKAYLLVPINKPLLKVINNLKNKFSVGLVTNNTSYRFEVLKRKGVVNIWKEFDNIHISSDIGSFKSEFFNKVCDLKSGLFVDNNLSFLKTIEEAGGNTLYYDSTKHDIDYLRDKLRKKTALMI